MKTTEEGRGHKIGINSAELFIEGSRNGVDVGVYRMNCNQAIHEDKG